MYASIRMSACTAMLNYPMRRMNSEKSIFSIVNDCYMRDHKIVNTIKQHAIFFKVAHGYILKREAIACICNINAIHLVSRILNNYIGTKTNQLNSRLCHYYSFSISAGFNFYEHTGLGSINGCLN